jgi:hypothetical protein
MADEHHLVHSLEEIRRNVESFNAGVARNRERAGMLLRQTTYWVADLATNTFGPSKYAGMADMSLDHYEETSDDFDGAATRQAIERTLGGKFSADETLTERLSSWGRALLGPEAFGGANSAKWRFLLLPLAVAKRPRNPKWNREELILALDLYLRSRPSLLDDTNSDVVALSETLNALPFRGSKPDAPRFRNPNGVALSSLIFAESSSLAEGCLGATVSNQSFGPSSRTIRASSRRPLLKSARSLSLRSQMCWRCQSRLFGRPDVSIQT